MSKLHNAMKKDKWIVTAQAFDRDTGEPLAKKTRDEVIDAKKNELFRGEKTAYGIKRKYEHFWNELNAPEVPREVVFVSKVRRKR